MAEGVPYDESTLPASLLEDRPILLYLLALVLPPNIETLRHISPDRKFKEIIKRRVRFMLTSRTSSQSALSILTLEVYYPGACNA